ncbi:glycogen/starch/alpha-glucan phosphorylase [bacterium]|nr:glycogen/starch/alpha-glucan phosphorylase [bacterium]
MNKQTTKQLLDGVPEFCELVKHYLLYSIGKDWDKATKNDIFLAVSLAVRQKIIDGMLETEKRQKNTKRLYYLSMEFLMGRSLGNNLYNLKIFDLCKESVEKSGYDLEEIREIERDAALGNGGLGRLAACFLDSLASLDLAGFGYGINYEYGLFKQEIDNGYQKEKPDNWLAEKTPWEIERPNETCLIPVYGKIVHAQDLDGNYNPMWMDWKVIIGVPHDMPIVGYGGKTVNYLRLYSARSSEDFDMQIFNSGDYLKAVEQKMSSETISKVLYPSDNFESGRELRLIQEYFFVACSIRDIFKRYLENNKEFDDFPNKVAIQLNDTHPALAVAELMRMFVDEHDCSWEKSWEITQKTLGYTNHTLLPEALEKWSVPLMENVLPRHLQIIFEINRRFLEEVRTKFQRNEVPNDEAKLRRMSIIEEGETKQVRMANLAIVGSHSVNGVAELHSNLVKTSLVPDFYQFYPEKFNNKTNGVTQRRWLLKANPLLSDLITKTIGDAWITNLYELSKLEPFATNKDFQKEFLRIKLENKKRLAKIIQKTNRLVVNPESLFDVQVKRVHEYKRQLLNAMQIIHQYFTIVLDGEKVITPRTYIFSGKAAPGYFMAKLIIKLINNIASVVNKDPKLNGQIKVVYIPDYRVSLAEKIFPASDLSEQISTAGKEASGTGNMKFAMNGALTIGTLDGANVEISEEVGRENIFIFGLTVEDIQRIQREKSYSTWNYYNENKNVKRVVDAIGSNLFCKDEHGLFLPIYDKLLNSGDEYFHLADLQSYIDTQQKISIEFKSTEKWAEKAILNLARMGKFSSDRTILEYAKDIWGLRPVGTVSLLNR